MAQGPLASLVGLNVVGLRRRGFAKSEILQLRQAYRDLFLGSGTFRDRLEQVEKKCGSDGLVGSVLAFVRSGTRPISNAMRRASTSAVQEA